MAVQVGSAAEKRTKIEAVHRGVGIFYFVLNLLLLVILLVCVSYAIYRMLMQAEFLQRALDTDVEFSSIRNGEILRVDTFQWIAAMSCELVGAVFCTWSMAAVHFWRDTTKPFFILTSIHAILAVAGGVMLFDYSRGGFVTKTEIPRSYLRVMRKFFQLQYHNAHDSLSNYFLRFQRRYSCCGILSHKDFETFPNKRSFLTNVLPESCCLAAGTTCTTQTDPDLVRPPCWPVLVEHYQAEELFTPLLSSVIVIFLIFIICEATLIATRWNSLPRVKTKKNKNIVQVGIYTDKTAKFKEHFELTANHTIDEHNDELQRQMSAIRRKSSLFVEPKNQLFQPMTQNLHSNEFKFEDHTPHARPYGLRPSERVQNPMTKEQHDSDYAFDFTTK